MNGDGSLGTYFDALYRITLRINSSLAVDQILAYLTEEAATAVRARAASVRLLDPAGRRLEMRAVYGLSENYLNKGPVDLDRSPVDREILGGQVRQLHDVSAATNFQYPQAAVAEGIVSLISVPLQARERAIGVLRVYSDRRRTFTDAETRFLVAVADLAALAIENARLYEELQRQYQTAAGDYEEMMRTLWGAEPAIDG